MRERERERERIVSRMNGIIAPHEGRLTVWIHPMNSNIAYILTALPLRFGFLIFVLYHIIDHFIY